MSNCCVCKNLGYQGKNSINFGTKIGEFDLKFLVATLSGKGTKSLDKGFCAMGTKIFFYVYISIIIYVLKEKTEYQPVNIIVELGIATISLYTYN